MVSISIRYFEISQDIPFEKRTQIFIDEVPQCVRLYIRQTPAYSSCVIFTYMHAKLNIA